jgi:hypothetical protein
MNVKYYSCSILHEDVYLLLTTTYLRQEYLKVKPQPTRSFIYQFYINAKSNDFILLVVKCLRNCCVQNSGSKIWGTSQGARS